MAAQGMCTDRHALVTVPGTVRRTAWVIAQHTGRRCDEPVTVPGTIYDAALRATTWQRSNPFRPVERSDASSTDLGSGG